MTQSERSLCQQWIASYIAPGKYINHMHGEIGLRMMMQTDTNVTVVPSEFRELMLEAGYEPANPLSHEWEFRITSKLLRLRPTSRVGGWTAAKTDYLWRRA